MDKDITILTGGNRADVQDPKGMIPAVKHVDPPEGDADGNHKVFPSAEPALKQ